MNRELATVSIGKIYTAILCTKEKWEEIGSGLGLSQETLKRIKEGREGRADQCLYAVINAWLHGKDKAREKGVSWRSLLRTLQSPKIGEGALADKLMSDQGLKPGARAIEKPRVTEAAPIQLAAHTDKLTIKGYGALETVAVSILTEEDLTWLLDAVKRVAYRWYDIGLSLGFLGGELRNIQSMPRLYSEAPHSFLREMLSQWLKWAEPNHKPPTVELLASALRNNGEEALAQSLKLRSIPRKDNASKLETYLRSFHRQSTSHNDTEWPPTLGVEYVNLVLIRQDRDKLPTFSQAFQRKVQLSTLGNIRDILNDDEFQKLSLSEITSYDAPRKVIIIEGAPGVGKTTLAYKLCHDWADERLLKEFPLVVYIPLRVPLMRVAESVEDLLGYFGENCTDADIQSIKGRMGKGVLFILDGWDELRPSCRDPDMFFPKLIRGHFLPESCVLVTSRPGASTDIRCHANRLIEILGFTEKQVKQYIYSYFKSCTHNVADKLIDDLEEYPNVSSTCYIAINLTIVCYVYWVSEFQLPSTLTEVYEQFVFHAVKRHFMRLSEGVIDPKLSNVRCVSNFDDSVSKVLKSLGKLALDGIQESELIFTKDKLMGVCPIDESEVQFDGFGLLKHLCVFRKHGTETLYHFLHLTVQEYFAAYSIAQMGEDEQGKVLANALWSQQLETVLKFFCGLDKFKSRPARIILSQSNQLAVPFVLECIFEGQWEDGCKKVAKSNSSTFGIRRDIQPYRSLVLGYIMAKSGSQWKLTWHNSIIGERELRSFSRFLFDVPTTLWHLCILKSSLATGSIQCIAQIVQSQVELTELTLSGMHLNDEAMDILCKALSDNKTLEVLKLSNNDFTSSSSESFRIICTQLLALQHLDVTGNELGESGCRNLLHAASMSTSVLKLCLPHTCYDLSDELHSLNGGRKEKGTPELKVTISHHVHNIV